MKLLFESYGGYPQNQQQKNEEEERKSQPCFSSPTRHTDEVVQCPFRKSPKEGW